MRFIKFLALFSLSILLGACGGGGSSGTITTPIPGGSVTSTLSMAKTSLDPASEETTTVTAIFTDNGKPLAGMPVQFSATPGYATFNPLDGKVYTDETGKASIVLQIAANPPVEGVAQLSVSAIINGTNVSQTTPFYVNKMSLKLDTPVLEKNRIPAGSSTTAYVQIVDAKGSPYLTPDGIDVYFSAERGSFIADNMVGKVRSNSQGRAYVTYVAPYSTSTQVTDTITATLGNVVVRTTITIDPRQASNIQYSYSTPAKTTFGYKQPITVNYRVSDSQGTALPDVPVTFTIAGEAAGATITATTPKSDAYGYVSATLKTGSSATMLWVTAKLSDGTAADSAVFSVTATGMSLSITPVTPAAPTTMASNANLPVSFKLVDAAGAPVAGQIVDLSVIDYKGGDSTAATLNLTSAATDAQGLISTTLVSKTTAANLWVKATLRATATTFATSGMITIQSSTEGSVALTLSTVTPKSKEAFMATVKFTSLSPPPYTDIQVVIKSDNPAVIEETSGKLDSQGNAYIMLTVKDVAETKRVNLWAEVGSSKSPITLVNVSPSGTTGTGALSLSIAPSAAKAGDTVFATVKYTNATGSLSGQTIKIISNKTDVIASTYTGITDSTGQAVIPLTISSGAPNSTVTLYASGGGTVSSTATVTVSSTSGGGSLTLAVAPTTPLPGANITATVQYTDSTASSLAGKSVTIVSNNSAITTVTTGVKTDSTGKAVIILKVNDNALKGTVVSLYATDGSTLYSPTTLVTIGSAVQDAAVLTLTVSPSTTAAVTGANTTVNIVVQGNKAVFTTSQGVPIIDQDIKFSIDRIDNGLANDKVTLNGTALIPGVPAPNSVTLKTDTTGTVLMPTIITGSIGASTTTHVFVIYWRAEATDPKSGLPVRQYGSTMVTITPPTPLTLAPSALSFAVLDPIGTMKSVAVSGGSTPYVSVSSTTAEIAVALNGTSIEITNTTGGVAGGAAATATVTVVDSAGVTKSLTVTYYK